jgi:hypothetical protein
MMRFLKELRVLALLIIMASAVTNVSAANENNDFDWDPVVDAIIHVESRGNAWARNGQYVGVLQMSPVVVKAVNQILQKRGSRKRYTLKDRYSEKKSREMFDIFMSYYNPGNSVEKAIRMWKGGTGYSIRATQKYYRTVMKYVDFN